VMVGGFDSPVGAPDCRCQRNTGTYRHYVPGSQPGGQTGRQRHSERVHGKARNRRFLYQSYIDLFQGNEEDHENA
ncbi:hypothetical protein MYX65_07815, partial [Acidobacteria bacterium AH-259-L09]|nr:hypothetical protein [Acidobacteria bacterium AH-259-L09]